MNRAYPEHTQTVQLDGHLDNQATGVDCHWHSPPNPQTVPWSCSSDHQTQSTQPTNRPLESTIWSPGTVHPTHKQTPGVVHLITRHSPPNPQTDPWSQPSDHLAQSTQPTDRPLELFIWSPDTVHPTYRQTPGVNHLITWHSQPNPQTNGNTSSAPWQSDPWSRPSRSGCKHPLWAAPPPALPVPRVLRCRWMPATHGEHTQSYVSSSKLSVLFTEHTQFQSQVVFAVIIHLSSTRLCYDCLGQTLVLPKSFGVFVSRSFTVCKSSCFFTNWTHSCSLCWFSSQYRHHFWWQSICERTGEPDLPKCTSWN